MNDRAHDDGPESSAVEHASATNSSSLRPGYDVDGSNAAPGSLEEGKVPDDDDDRQPRPKSVHGDYGDDIVRYNDVGDTIANGNAPGEPSSAAGDSEGARPAAGEEDAGIAARNTDGNGRNADDASSRSFGAAAAGDGGDDAAAGGEKGTDDVDEEGSFGSFGEAAVGGDDAAVAREKKGTDVADEEGSFGSFGEAAVGDDGAAGGEKGTDDADEVGSFGRFGEAAVGGDNDGDDAGTTKPDGDSDNDSFGSFDEGEEEATVEETVGDPVRPDAAKQAEVDALFSGLLRTRSGSGAGMRLLRGRSSEAWSNLCALATSTSVEALQAEWEQRYRQDPDSGTNPEDAATIPAVPPSSSVEPEPEAMEEAASCSARRFRNQVWCHPARPPVRLPVPIHPGAGAIRRKRQERRMRQRPVMQAVTQSESQSETETQAQTEALSEAITPTIDGRDFGEDGAEGNDEEAGWEKKRDLAVPSEERPPTAAATATAAAATAGEETSRPKAGEGEEDDEEEDEEEEEWNPSFDEEDDGEEDAGGGRIDRSIVGSGQADTSSSGPQRAMAWFDMDALDQELGGSASPGAEQVRSDSGPGRAEEAAAPESTATASAWSSSLPWNLMWGREQDSLVRQLAQCGVRLRGDRAWSDEDVEQSVRRWLEESVRSVETNPNATDNVSLTELMTASMVIPVPGEAE